MLSIIIADDETGIIDLCRMLIRYPGAVVVGEAHNGIELLDKIRELHPNTVITDISMPGMTGLELIEKARTAYPEVNFIVMSGYTDFEYVQSALRFGVWDYLLKPLNKTELNRILKKLDEHLADVQAQSDQKEMMEEDFQESLSMLRDRYIREVWQKRAPLAVPRIGGVPILPAEDRVYQCFLVCADSLLTMQEMEPASMLLQAESAMEALASMEASYGADAVTFPTDPASVMTLLVFKSEAGEPNYEDLQRAMGGEIRRFNSQNGFVHLTGALSQLQKGGWELLPKMMDQVTTAIKWRLEKRQAALLQYQEATAVGLERMPTFSKTADLREAVLENRADDACKLIEQAWGNVDGTVPGSEYRVMEEILECLNNAFCLLPGVECMERAPRIEVREVLHGHLTPSALPQHVQKRVRELLSAYYDFFRQRENSVISHAKQYVQQHLAEDISLNDVAKQVCLSPAYFSTLFKAETGCGFIKYLQRIRVEQAKKLLKNKGMRIKDIAEAVGYKDVKFFNKIFLNETSVTPSEYRRFYA
jgi:two-component system response regulator YesN